MSSKQWFTIFLCSILIITLLLIITGKNKEFFKTYLRNALNDMAFVKMSGDDTVYEGKYNPNNNYTKKVPILMYHHLAEKSNGSSVISIEKFESQIKALSQAGYTGVSLKQLVDYVEKGIELPEKPIVITFDDGYASNYEIAYPILKKYNMKATIFVIGSTVGKDTYKDTGHKIIPHFSYEEAKEMVDSGLIEIQSHTYDMHQHPDYEKGEARNGVVQLDGESEESFVKAIRTDFLKSKKEIEKGTGQEVFALAYPLGKYSNLSEVVLKEMGVKTTLSVESGANTLIKGLPQSLQAMKRFSISEEISPEKLIELLSR